MILTLKSVALSTLFDFGRQLSIFDVCNGWGPSLFQKPAHYVQQVPRSLSRASSGSFSSVCQNVLIPVVMPRLSPESVFLFVSAGLYWQHTQLCYCLTGLWEVYVFLPPIFLAWSAFPLRFLRCHFIASFLCLNELKLPPDFKCFNKCSCQAASDRVLWCFFQRRPLTRGCWREKR